MRSPAEFNKFAQLCSLLKFNFLFFQKPLFNGHSNFAKKRERLKNIEESTIACSVETLFRVSTLATLVADANVSLKMNVLTELT